MKDYTRNMILLVGCLGIIIGAQRLGLGDLGAIIAFLFAVVVLGVIEVLQRRREGQRTRVSLRRLVIICRLNPDELRQRLEDK